MSAAKVGNSEILRMVQSDASVCRSPVAHALRVTARCAQAGSIWDGCPLGACPANEMQPAHSGTGFSSGAPSRHLSRLYTFPTKLVEQVWECVCRNSGGHARGGS